MNKILTKGYTLIEILVALAVFAILAVITSSAMYRAFDTRARLSIQADRLNTLQLALSLVERDTVQITARAIIADDMHPLPAFIGQTQYVEFTRGGMANPGGNAQRSTLQRVALLCSGKSLKRRSWDTLDGPNHKQYHERTLINNVDECNFAYLSNSHQVLSEWRENAVQQNQKQETLPMAIQLTLTLHNWGKMSLLYPIPEAVYDVKE